MLLHKRIPLDYHRRAELFFNTVHKLGSSESNTIWNPSTPLLHSKLAYCRLLQKACTEEQHCMEGKGGGGKLKFPF